MPRSGPTIRRSTRQPTAANSPTGVTYWQAVDGVQGACDRRIFVGTVDARLVALDAERGAPCPDFGQAGQVDLSQGVDLGEYQADTREYGVTSPPVVIGDLVVVGSAIGDNRAATLERGIVRALTHEPARCAGCGIRSLGPQPTPPEHVGRWQRRAHRRGQRVGTTFG